MGGRGRGRENGERARDGGVGEERERKREREREKKGEKEKEKHRDQATTCPTNHHKWESTTTIQVETHTNHRWDPQQLKVGPARPLTPDQSQGIH